MGLTVVGFVLLFLFYLIFPAMSSRLSRCLPGFYFVPPVLLGLKKRNRRQISTPFDRASRCCYNACKTPRISCPLAFAGEGRNNNDSGWPHISTPLSVPGTENWGKQNFRKRTFLSPTLAAPARPLFCYAKTGGTLS